MRLEVYIQICFSLMINKGFAFICVLFEHAYPHSSVVALLDCQLYHDAFVIVGLESPSDPNLAYNDPIG